MAEGAPAPGLDEASVARRAAEVGARAAEVWDRIESAGGRRHDITLVAVTKTWPVETVAAALRVGLVDLGENYAQDLAAKAAEAAALGLEPRWHFIGGLQRNKVKRLAGTVAVWQTIDRPVLVDEVARRQPGAEILVQVNTTGEPQKSGCEPETAQALVDRGRELGLMVSGLMTLGPTGGGDPRPSFDLLRELAARCEVTELSMGMTADVEAAVACGATIVRLGTALFGPRPR